MVDPEVLDKIKRACSPQKAIYDIANYVETDVIPPINEATNTANAAAAQANSAYNRATDALNTANSVAENVSRSLVDLNAAGDGSTVTLNAPRNTGNPATAPLPVADATKAGVMNSATYVNLQNLNTRVSSLENQTTTYIVSFTNDNPTQDEINNAYKTAYPTAPFPPIDGTTVIDSTRQLYYRWVKNGAIWLKTTGFVISQWTNDTLGTVKGSTTAGQIQAETDGTGSLVGYDTLVSNIAQNTTAIGTANSRIDAVETKNTEQDTSISNAQTSANNAFVGASISKNANNQILNLSRGTGAGVNLSISPVDTQNAGLVTPVMFNQWNAVKGVTGLETNKGGTITSSTPVEINVIDDGVLNFSIRFDYYGTASVKTNAPVAVGGTFGVVSSNLDYRYLTTMGNDAWNDIYRSTAFSAIRYIEFYILTGTGSNLNVAYYVKIIAVNSTDTSVNTNVLTFKF